MKYNVVAVDPHYGKFTALARVSLREAEAEAKWLHRFAEVHNVSIEYSRKRVIRPYKSCC